MNEKGFCAAVYQLPDFYNDTIIDEVKSKTPRPVGPDQKTGKKQIMSMFVINRLLTNCATVADAVKYLQSHDLTAIARWLNLHYYVADADGNILTLEYWKNSQGQDTLFALTPEDRNTTMHSSPIQVPYEYYSIENYYTNPIAVKTYSEDFWQYNFSGKTRVGNMMLHYSMVMEEEDALRCLQYGNFSVDKFNKVTDWSCVYNPKKLTVLFNIHDDLSSVYSINLKDEFK